MVSSGIWVSEDDARMTLGVEVGRCAWCISVALLAHSSEFDSKWSRKIMVRLLPVGPNATCRSELELEEKFEQIRSYVGSCK